MKLTWAFAATAAGLSLLAALASIPLASHPGAAPDPAPTAPPPRVARAATQPPPMVTATAGAVSLSARLSSAYVIAGTSEVRGVVEVHAAERPTSQERGPVNLAVVIDRSGSMRGEKLDAAKLAASRLVDQLTPQDHLAVVHYGSDVQYWPTTAGSPEGKERLRHYIAAIECDGATDIGAALTQAASLVEQGAGGYASNRIVLITDGQPTAGMVEPAQLQLLAENIHRRGMAVTALGVGSDFNETLMRAMAENGAGFYGYIADATRLEDIFSRELHQAAAAVARNVEVRLDLAPGVELIDVLGRPSSVEGRVVTTSLYDLSSGLSGQFVVRLRVTAPDVRHAIPITGVRLNYTEVQGHVARATELSLTAEVTDRPEVVLAHVDSDVETRSLHALGAKEMLRATEEFRTGNRTGALTILGNVRQLFSASSNALAGDVQKVDAEVTELQRARTPEEMRTASMSTAKRTLANFGNNLDMY
jgi:Ca-activated chloride channel family protein